MGNAVVKELAARGHEVTAFARNIDKVFAADNVTAVAADVTAADFAGKLQGFDAVVSAFNPGWNNPNIGTDFAKGAAAITEAAKAAAVPYLLVVGGAGSLYVAPGVQLIDTPEFPQEIFAGANAARNLLTDLRPPPRCKLGVYRARRQCFTMAARRKPKANTASAKTMC